MVGGPEACTECTRNCLLIHRNNLGEGPKVYSFFKVMFGKHFSEVMFLPPKLMKTLKFSGGTKMYLQDSSGQKWTVELSKENGDPAFLYGWSEFVRDHCIEMGDFVVFHYIKKSSKIAVQIFGRSGCEKLAHSTSKNKQKKMKTSRDAFNLHHLDGAFTPDPPAKKNPSACRVSQPNEDVTYNRHESKNNISTSSAMARNASSHENIAQGLKRESATNFVEDLSCMLDRHMSFTKGDKDDLFDLFDLSVFEIPEKKAGTKEVENPTASVDTRKFLVAEGNTFSRSCLLKKEPSSLPSSYPSRDMPPSSSMKEQPVEMPQKSEILVSPGSWDWIVMPNIPNPSGVAFGLEDLGPCVDGWWRELGNPTSTSTPAPMSPRPTPNTVSSKMVARTRVVKQEPREFTGDCGADVVADISLGFSCGNANLSSNGEPGIVVKCEPVDLFDSPPEPVANVLVPANSESFLELPETLPIRACRAAKMEKKMVILHDPAGKLWPVLYHQRHGFKVLACGWAAFRKANNIQEGDKCTFAVENRDGGIFAVTVHRS